MEKIGRYKIVQRLGRGGMAEVWLAQHPTLKRQVAIKLVHTFLQLEDGADQRFVQEAQLVAALRHPNIVQLYDFDIVDGRPFMVMEYLSGGTLHTLLRNQRRQQTLLPLNETIRLVQHIATGLAYAHAQGAVHRDLKPANVLLTDQGDPVISDFGIAKLLSGQGQLSAVGSVMGTPMYMSPEQAQGLPVDARSDIYALGVMLFEMLTGRVPFSAETPAALLAQHVHTDPPQPKQLNPNIPPAIEQVVLRALAKQPNLRFDDAAQMGAALHNSGQGYTGTDGLTAAVTVVETDFSDEGVAVPVNITNLAHLNHEAQVTASVIALAHIPLTPNQLATIVNEPEETILIALDALWQAGLIAQDKPQHGYQFADETLREKILSRINPAQRTLLHRKCATVLAPTHAGVPEAGVHYGAAAFHYQEAGLMAQAVLHYSNAGEYAASAGAYEQAIANYTNAVSIMEADETIQIARAAIYFGLALSVQKRDGWKKSDVGEMLRLARQWSDTRPERQPAIVLCQWLHHIARVDLEDAYCFAQELWQMVQDTVEQPTAHFVLAVTLQQQGRLAPATVHYKRGLAHLPLIDCNGLAAYFALDLRVLLAMGSYYAALSQGDVDAAARFLSSSSAFFQ